MLDGLAKKPNLNVVQTAKDLPFDAPYDANSTIWRGGFYLVAGNISSREDAREVVIHEIFGHFGMAGFFGRELNIALDEIHKKILELESLRTNGD